MIKLNEDKEKQIKYTTKHTIIKPTTTKTNRILKWRVKIKR